MNRARLAMFLAFLSLGCPKRPVALDFGEVGEVTDPQTLLTFIKAAEARVVTLEGESKLRIDSPETKGTVTLFVAVSRPALLHFEPLDFFGRPQGLLVTNGERFMLYAAEEGKTYLGPASPQNVSRFLPVVLPAEELVAILLGQAPRLVPESMTLATDPAAGGYVLTLTRGEIVQTLIVDPTFHRVLRSEVRGAPAYDLAFSDFQTEGPSVMPREVTLIAEASNTRVTIRYTDVKLNAPPDLTMFDLEPIPDLPVLQVDALGRVIDPPAPPTP